MTEMKPPSILKFGPEVTMWTEREKRIDRLVALGTFVVVILGLFYWWPTFATFWRFVSLCFFPAVVPISYGVVRSGMALRAPRVRIVVSITILVHCGLLAGTAYLWRAFPSSSRSGDFMFGFIAVDGLIILLLMRLAWPRQPGAPR